MHKWTWTDIWKTSCLDVIRRDRECGGYIPSQPRLDISRPAHLVDISTTDISVESKAMDISNRMGRWIYLTEGATDISILLLDGIYSAERAHGYIQQNGAMDISVLRLYWIYPVEEEDGYIRQSGPQIYLPSSSTGYIQQRGLTDISNLVGQRIYPGQLTLDIPEQDAA